MTHVYLCKIYYNAYEQSPIGVGLTLEDGKAICLKKAQSRGDETGCKEWESKNTDLPFWVSYGDGMADYQIILIPVNEFVDRL